MRIVAGTAKGMQLISVEGESTRPTLDRVKENFFNAIAFELEDKKVLDLFAGSGQLGLEALSRGAKKAVFVDSDANCVEAIKRNAQKAKLFSRCNVYQSDYLEYLSVFKKRRGFDKLEKFDIVFLDPPYESVAIKDVVKRLLRNGYIAGDGIIICESDMPELVFDADIAEEYFAQRKEYKYGRVYITVIKIKAHINTVGDETDEK